MRTICMVAATLLMIGCFKMPIGYYTFLRIAITLAALKVLINEVQKDVTLIGICFIIIAIIFNPIIPIYLYNKMIWMPIDILTALLFLVYGFNEKIKQKP